MGRLGIPWRSLRSTRHMQVKRANSPGETKESHHEENCSEPGVDVVLEVQAEQPQQHKNAQEEPKAREKEFQSRMDWGESKMDDESSLRLGVSDGDSLYSTPCLDDEVQKQLDAILALKRLVHTQRKTITRLREYKRKVKRRHDDRWGCSTLSFISEDEASCRSSTFDDGPRKYSVSFGPTLEKSDIEVLSVISFEDCESCELEHMEEEFRDAADEIRKQASQMEAAIALDKLDTCETELERVKRELKTRSNELVKVKAELETERHRVGMIEQERDLYEAEATRTKDDLDICIDYMAKLGIMAAYDGHDAQRAPTVQNESSPESPPPIEKQVSSPSRLQQVFRLGKSSSQESTRSRESTVESKTKQPLLVTPEKTVAHAEQSDCRSVAEAVRQFDASAKGANREEWSPYGQSTDESALFGHDDKSQRSNGSPRSKSLGWFGNAKHYDNPRHSPRHKRDRKLQRSHVRKGADKKTDGAIEATNNGEVRALSTTTTAATATATVERRYYETVLGTLQKEIVDLKTEKMRRESDLRNTVQRLETEAQSRSAHIEKLEHELSALRHETVDANTLREQRPSSPRRFC